MTSKICIAISGTHGAGTSTAAKKIAKLLGLRFVSAGDIFREAAKKRGYKDVSNFKEIVEGDPELKDELDTKMKEEAEKGDVVVEGRIACWTAHDYAHLRIMIDAPLQVRVARIADRSGRDFEEAKQETSKRERQEKQWFLKHRGVDLDNLSIFDIVINTENLTSDQVVDLILSAIPRKLRKEHIPILDGSDAFKIFPKTNPLYFHGTRSQFLPGILENGLQPITKHPEWDLIKSALSILDSHNKKVAFDEHKDKVSITANYPDAVRYADTGSEKLHLAIVLAENLVSSGKVSNEDKVTLEEFVRKMIPDETDEGVVIGLSPYDLNVMDELEKYRKMREKTLRDDEKWYAPFIWRSELRIDYVSKDNIVLIIKNPC